MTAPQYEHHVTYWTRINSICKENEQPTKEMVEMATREADEAVERMAKE
jgi:hypothetical protein